MANQKYTGMKILRLLLWLLVLSMAIPSTILATTATQFSNVGDYPIAVTLGLILTIVLFQLMVLSVTQKYCCNSNSRWQIKSIRDENPALTAVVTGAVNGDTINYTLATTTQFSNVGISYCCDFRS
jgi:membrane protein DedA with SNARE-associated domain